MGVGVKKRKVELENLIDGRNCGQYRKVTGNNINNNSNNNNNNGISS